jgi:hypothetical protein
MTNEYPSVPIYLAVENTFVPIARYFFPQLEYDEHRNWVRISRTIKNGEKPPEHLLAYGGNHNLRGDAAPVPISTRIDKCTGAISEVVLERGKVH